MEESRVGLSLALGPTLRGRPYQSTNTNKFHRFSYPTPQGRTLSPRGIHTFPNTRTHPGYPSTFPAIELQWSPSLTTDPPELSQGFGTVPSLGQPRARRSACPAPAQSRPLPNPIVPPGLGLASRLARTKCDAGRATPAAPGDRAPAPPAAPPPWGPGPGAGGRLSCSRGGGDATAPGGRPSSCLPLRPRVGTRRSARRLCRERSGDSRAARTGGSGGGAGMGAPSPTLDPASSGSRALAAASDKQSFPNPPQNPPEGRREPWRVTRRPLKGLCSLSPGDGWGGERPGLGALLRPFLHHPTVGAVSSLLLRE